MRYKPDVFCKVLRRRKTCNQLVAGSFCHSLSYIQGPAGKRLESTGPMSEADIMLPMRTGEIRIHDEAGFEGMRKAGRLVAQCLDMLVDEVKPGVTTGHIDDLIREFVYDSWCAVRDDWLSRLSPRFLYFAQSRHLPRYSGRSRAERWRHREH